LWAEVFGYLKKGAKEAKKGTGINHGMQARRLGMENDDQDEGRARFQAGKHFTI